MKISSICLKNERDGLHPFKKINLGNNVIIAGENGSGKTRLLKLLEKYIELLKKGNEDSFLELEIENEDRCEVLTKENVHKIRIANYSHFDAQLQPPNNFTPYVICKAKEILRTCNYEETALNSLLLLEDMAHGYSEEFKDGIQFKQFADSLYKAFNIEIKIDENSKELKISDLNANKSSLSPGQQYLLRVAVACYCNVEDEKLIFLLDEPELHLHPQALIELINALRHKFPETQFWISTHSLALISYITVIDKSATVLYMENGNTDIFRSNSSKLLSGLIGTEENRFAIRQLIALPDEYACNKFATECYDLPATLEASGNDSQTSMIQTILHENDVVLDYGAGKGRFFEELASTSENIISRIQYYAYDKYDKDSCICKQVMNRFGSTEKNYFNDENELLSIIKLQADYVLLINVLHEIPPKEWRAMFKVIRQLLKDTGKLIIVEREELTIGESPYNNGFLVLTEDGAKELFGPDHFLYEKHATKDYIVKYTVSRTGLSINDDQISGCIKAIQKNSLQIIKELKNDTCVENDKQRFHAGIKLAFHLQQYANSALLIEELNNKNFY